MLKRKFGVILVLLVLLLYPGLPVSGVWGHQENTTGIKTANGESMRSMAFEIIEGLIGDLVQTGDQAKWPRIIDPPPRDWDEDWNQYFYGYHWGTAGIADVLLSFYLISLNKTLLEYAEKAANFIIKGARADENGGIYWFTGEGTRNRYIGKKYGNAGIASLLLHLYQYTKNSTYSELLNRTLITLKYQANTNLSLNGGVKYWGYGMNDIIGVSDFNYGTVGIVSAFLEAGHALNEPEWKNIAISGARWLESIAMKENPGTMALPWSTSSPYDSHFYTGLGSGNAGIGSFFLNLYDSTGDERWLTNAKRIGNWLLEKTKGDNWANGGVVYSTGIDSTDIITGIDAGAAGVGKFFLELYKKSMDLRYANGAIDAADWLLRSAISTDAGFKWPKAITGEDSEVYMTGYSYGAAGIGAFFGEMYETFGCPQFKNMLLGAANWLETQKTNHNRFPVATGKPRLTTSLSQYGHHLSYYDGSAGIALFLLNANYQINATPLFPDLISCEGIGSEEYLQPEDLLLSVLGSIAVSSMVIIPAIRAKYKKQRHLDNPLNDEAAINPSLNRSD
ncbi:MAG: lanthionine synthetase LanC family protein [Candidatus Thorarchaeota archaeon]